VISARALQLEADLVWRGGMEKTQLDLRFQHILFREPVTVRCSGFDTARLAALRCLGSDLEAALGLLLAVAADVNRSRQVPFEEASEDVAGGGRFSC
jgi:hypothetical protein